MKHGPPTALILPWSVTLARMLPTLTYILISTFRSPMLVAYVLDTADSDLLPVNAPHGTHPQLK